MIRFFVAKSVLFLVISTQYGLVLAANYAGSETCKVCHSEIYSQYIKTGHPHKIQKIQNRAPVYPAATSPGVPKPPPGHNWSDITYVIGGFGWKARFMDRDGYIMTGAERQYNLANPHFDKGPHWASYGGPKHGRKPYTCGECHVTGWVATGVNGPHQDKLPGIHGTWAEPGVTCEACHGAAAAHVAAPGLVKPAQKESCSRCHMRDDPQIIESSNGLIRHHEQHDELLASPHKGLACTTCHDPHRSTRYKTGGYRGDEKTCKACHAGVQIKMPVKAAMACNDCHMPHAVTSALSSTVSFSGASVEKGDLRTHIYRITTRADWTMLTADGQRVRVDEKQRAYLTLDHVCLSCHTNQDMNWARTQAKHVH